MKLFEITVFKKKLQGHTSSNFRVNDSNQKIFCLLSVNRITSKSTIMYKAEARNWWGEGGGTDLEPIVAPACPGLVLVHVGGQGERGRRTIWKHGLFENSI